jgi:NifU-like protein involved in Fe-S cluster formation
MADDFDNFVQDLQNRIFDEARTAYGEIAFQRWLNPLNMGTIKDADGYGRVAGTCGDTMEIFLKIEEERHCAFLAAETLQVALDDYFRKELQKKQIGDEPSHAKVPLRNLTQSSG